MYIEAQARVTNLKQKLSQEVKICESSSSGMSHRVPCHSCRYPMYIESQAWVTNLKQKLSQEVKICESSSSGMSHRVPCHSCRYPMYIESQAWVTNLKQKLACGSILISNKMEYYEFFTRALKPGIHYVEVDQNSLCLDTAEKVRQAFESLDLVLRVRLLMLSARVNLHRNLNTLRLKPRQVSGCFLPLVWVSEIASYLLISSWFLLVSRASCLLPHRLSYGCLIYLLMS